jgi:putative ABC transport system permease protein
MGAGLLATGFIFTEIQNFLIDFQFYEILRSDVDLTFVDERGVDAWEEARQLPGVDYAEPLLNVACTFVHGPYRRKAGVTGLLPQARLTVPRDQSGQRIPLPQVGLVLTRRLAEILHVAPGDPVTIIPVKGERRPVQTRVSQVADSYIGLAAYARIGYLSRLVNGEFTVTGAQLATSQIASEQRQLYRQLKQTPGVQSVAARRDIIQNLIDTLLNNQFVFIGLLIIFSGVVFFGSIVNSSMVSLAERQREVATFRALGYGPWQIGGMFLRENLMVNLCGTMLGLPFGYLMVVLTSLAYAENDLIRLPVVTAPWVWLATVAFSLVFALLAHGVVQLRIHRMDYLEALNVKE